MAPTNERRAKLDFLPGPDSAALSRAFLSNVSRRLGSPQTSSSQRIVFFVDRIELQEPRRAIEWLERAEDALGNGFAMVAAFDPSRLVPGSSRIGRVHRAT